MNEVLMRTCRYMETLKRPGLGRDKLLINKHLVIKYHTLYLASNIICTFIANITNFSIEHAYTQNRKKNIWEVVLLTVSRKSNKLMHYKFQEEQC